MDDSRKAWNYIFDKYIRSDDFDNERLLKYVRTLDEEVKVHIIGAFANSLYKTHKKII